MDPDANLREQEEILSRNAATVGRIDRADRDRLIELRQALYAWIRDGGFAPDWEQAPRARKFYGR